jgi:hypothetical protein
MDRWTAGRQVLLGAVAFVATLLVLVGLSGVVGRAPGASPTAPAIGPSASAPAGSAPAGASNGPSVAPSPTALTGPTGDPILIGAGDIADCESDGDEATAALLDGLPGTVFTAGDNVYPSGTIESFEACYTPSWGRHLARTRPAPGNHDRPGESLDGYVAYYGAAGTGPDGEPWYAYDLGTWHIIVLDSNCTDVGGCDPDSPQGRWLASDLAASRARCTLAIWHHPRFSSGDEHGNDPAMDPLWRTLYAAGADVVVNGHDHDYERFAPQDPDGNEDRARGMRQFVIGTGGTALRGFDDPVANSELRAAVSHGLLEFTLRDGGYDWRFIPTRGDFSDRGTASCH